MSAKKKHIQDNNTNDYNIQVIYTRGIDLQVSCHDINLKQVLSYDLLPVTYIFLGLRWNKDL